MEPEIGATPHYYDGWHLAKWLGNELRKVAKLDGCDEIGAWIEKLRTHLWNAIEHAADSNTDMSFSGFASKLYKKGTKTRPRQSRTSWPLTIVTSASCRDPLPSSSFHLVVAIPSTPPKDIYCDNSPVIFNLSSHFVVYFYVYICPSLC
nr:unnamed protein product [Haemonchus contortus]